MPDDDHCEGLKPFDWVLCKLGFNTSESFRKTLKVVNEVPSDIRELANEQIALMPKASLVERTVAIEQVLRENQLYDAAFQMSLIIPQLVQPSDRRGFTTICTALENRAFNLEKLGRTSEAKDIRTLASYVGSPRSRSKNRQ